MIHGELCAHNSFPDAVLVNFIMAEDSEKTKKSSIKGEWNPSLTGPKALFQPGEFDIFVNKVTKEVFIFHAPELKYTIDRLEYDPIDHTVTVFTKEGLTMDLGIKIHWLIRSYLARTEMVFVVRTKDGEALDGVEVPLVIKGQKH